jgi:hypothetical protein
VRHRRFQIRERERVNVGDDGVLGGRTTRKEEGESEKESSESMMGPGSWSSPGARVCRGMRGASGGPRPNYNLKLAFMLEEREDAGALARLGFGLGLGRANDACPLRQSVFQLKRSTNKTQFNAADPPRQTAVLPRTSVISPHSLLREDADRYPDTAKVARLDFTQAQEKLLLAPSVLCLDID